MDNVEIATTILEQIGGKALMMIGSRQHVAIEKGLSLKVGRGAKHPVGGQVTHLEIVLDADDTYTFRAIRINIRAKEMRKVLEEITGVYCDMLHEQIESTTGMYTKLF